jgi:hypothetical protein
MRGELRSQEQTTWIGNSRCNSVCRLARIEWNSRGQGDTPARRRRRVSSLRRLAFFQPIAKDLEGFVEDRSQLWEDRATARKYKHRFVRLEKVVFDTEPPPKNSQNFAPMKMKGLRQLRSTNGMPLLGELVLPLCNHPFPAKT